MSPNPNGQAGAPGRMPPAAANTDQSIDDVPMFKRKRVVVPLLTVLIAAVVGGWYWYGVRSSMVSTDDAYIDANRSAISAKVLGRIVELHYDEGDTVRQGDTLVRLDDADVRAQLAKAEAAVRYNSRNAEIESVNLAKARDDFDRTAKQFKSQIVSQEQYSHTENAQKLAVARGDMVAAQIATAQADLAIVKTQMNNMAVVAPFSGVVAKRWVLKGDVVQPGQTIFSMYDVGHLWVTANLEETKLRQIHPGSPARISIDAYPGVSLPGKVLSIGRSTAAQFSIIPPSNASGNFTKVTQRVAVKLSIDTPPPASAALLPGLSASVNIFTR